MNASPMPGGSGGPPDAVLAYLDSIEGHLREIDRRIASLEEWTGIGATGMPEATVAAPVGAVEPEATVTAPVGAVEPEVTVILAAEPAAAIEPVAGLDLPAAPAVEPASAVALGDVDFWTAVDGAAAATDSEEAVGRAKPIAAEPAMAAEPARPQASFRDLEARLTGRALAWAGGAATILGAIFLLSLAFSRGWITEEMRVGLGLVGGAAFLGLAAWCFERRQPMLGHVLSAVGLGVLSLALYAASSVFGFIAPEVALAGSFCAAVAAAVMAIRYDTQVVAAFGLVAVLAAPPVLGAPGNLVTMAFLGTALVGTTLISLFKSWPWLPRMAFILTAPQVLWWVIGSPQPGVALGVAVLAAFWALNAVAATGTELASRRTTLGWSSGLLLVLDALFTAGAGAALIWSRAPDLAGALLAALGLANLVLATVVFQRRGDHHPFGLLAAATGVVGLVVAVPVEYEGARVALLWTLLAVGLVVPYARRGHGYAAIGALAVGGLAVGHLALVEYPLESWTIAGTATDGVPFVSEGGAALAGLLAGLLAAGWMLRDARTRVALGIAAALLAAYALPFELTGFALVGGWLALTLALVAGQRFVAAEVPVPGPSLRLAEEPTRWLAAAALVPAGLAVVFLPAVVLPPPEFAWPPPPPVPFTDEGAAYAALIIAGLLAAAVVTVDTVLRPAAVVAATAVAAYLVPFEVGPTASVVLWCGLAALQAVAVRLDRPGTVAYVLTAASVGGIAIARTLIEIAPPSRLLISPDGLAPHPLFISDATLAIGVVAILLAGAAWFARAERPVSIVLRGAAMAALVYLVTIAVVDEFAGRVGGPVPFDSLVLQAETALVVAWCLLAAGQAVAYRFDREGWPAYAAVAAVLTGLSAVMAVLTIARPERLAVSAAGIEPHPFLVSEATLALGAVAAILAGAAWILRATPVAAWLRVGAGVAIVYLLSVGVVDEFAGRVGGPVALEELQRQAQVALSILWAAIGFGTFAVGAVRGWALAREFGLALLAIATVKVFVFDLSFLDVAYRVLSFIGLGLLLLAGAFVFQWHKPKPGGHGRAA